MVAEHGNKGNNKIRFYAKMTEDGSGTGNTLKSGYPIFQEDLHVNKEEASLNLRGTQPFRADHSTSPLMKIGPKLCILKTRERLLFR